MHTHTHTQLGEKSETGRKVCNKRREMNRKMIKERENGTHDKKTRALFP